MKKQYDKKPLEIATKGMVEYMQQIDRISVEELRKMSKKLLDPLVKAVVDVRRKIVVVDADLHVDEELFLLENGSAKEDLWGINLWPELYGGCGFIEFDALINMRPFQNNRSRGVEDESVRRRIQEIVGGVVYAG
ncbi:MAG: DUF5674 family protein [Clostridiales bacterium]|jgi:hypothetical protein|nr:DUF5674 family protein [Clostridiales bacterium]